MLQSIENRTGPFLVLLLCITSLWKSLMNIWMNRHQEDFFNKDHTSLAKEYKACPCVEDTEGLVGKGEHAPISSPHYYITPKYWKALLRASSLYVETLTILVPSIFLTLVPPRKPSRVGRVYLTLTLYLFRLLRKVKGILRITAFSLKDI